MQIHIDSRRWHVEAVEPSIVVIIKFHKCSTFFRGNSSGKKRRYLFISLFALVKKTTEIGFFVSIASRLHYKQIRRLKALGKRFLFYTVPTVIDVVTRNF